MSTVSRYLLREFLIASAAVLLAVCVTWLAADTLLHIDEIRKGPGALLHSSMWRLLEVLPQTIPASCAVGAVLSLTRAVRAREITAIRCGGIPLRAALAPVLGAAVLIAVATGWFEDRVLIKSRQERVGPDAGARAPRPELRNGRYWYASGTSIFVAAGYDPDTGALEDVSAFELSPSRSVLRHIEADAAHFVAGHSWEFRDAVVREFRGSGLGQRQVQTLEVDLGLSGGDVQRAQRPLHRETLHGLASRLRHTRSSSEDRLVMEATFHARLAGPVAVLILVLFAIPFAVGDVERGDSLPRALLGTLVATAAFWTLWALGLITARSGVLPPAFPVWGMVLLALGVGSWRYRALRE